MTNIKLRRFLGFMVIGVISLIPVFLWFFLGNGAIEFSKSITHSLGELFGLVGMALFAISFVLSTRIKVIENVFGGLDKVYPIHAVVGGIAFVLILAHPVFLVLKFIPSNIPLAAEYLLPSAYWSANFGIIALTGFVFLMFLTLYTKIRYNLWKFSHEFLGAVFAIAVLHIFMVRGVASGDIIFSGYYIYAGVVSFVGVSSFLYSLLIRKSGIKNFAYKVESIRQIKDNFEIIMTPEEKPIKYKSGQFIFVRFYHKHLPSESHPFSIASKSDSPRIKIIVKKLGDFTEDMGKITIGDKVLIEGPYGRFGFDCSPRKDQIWLAGGIGITPFLGMAEDIGERCPSNKIDLYYTGRGKEFIGGDILSKIHSKSKALRVFLWDSGEKGHLNLDAIKKNSEKLEEKEFFLCGPERFKQEIIKELLAFGIKKSAIHQEEFEFK